VASEIPDTTSGTVPVLLIVACSGAEVLLGVTFPKSNVEGNS
jgi:hypothetical protein